MHQLLRHVLDDVCEDPDCEVHQIEVGLEEHTVTQADLAFFIAGAQRMEQILRARYFKAEVEAGKELRALVVPTEQV